MDSGLPQVTVSSLICFVVQMEPKILRLVRIGDNLSVSPSNAYLSVSRLDGSLGRTQSVYGLQSGQGLSWIDSLTSSSPSSSGCKYPILSAV